MTEDARPDRHQKSRDGVNVPDQDLVAALANGDSEHGVSADAQIVLQKLAQDATSQADDDAVVSAQQQEDEPTMAGADEHALVNGHALGLDNNADDTDGNNAIYPGGVEGLGESFEALPTYPIHQHYDTSLDLTQANIEALADDPMLEAAASVVESEAPRIQAFAKLEFDDGEFYMNTYSVELGRDVRAARQAYERDVQTLQQIDAKLRKRSSSSGDISHSSGKAKKEYGRHLSGSVVSESGGVMGLDHSDSDGTRQRRSKKSKSATSSSQQLSRKSSMNLPGMRTDYQSLAMASLLDSSADAQLVDPRSTLPSPESCPLVPIHPPASTDGIPTSHKSISRKHVKIAFNFEKHLFEIIVLGRNGAFVDEEWYPEGDVQPLRSGSLIQIGGVGIRFLLPDVALGETGAENTMGSDPASFELGNGYAANGDMDDSEDNDDDDEPDEDESESRENSQEDESDESDRSDEVPEEETRGRTRRRPEETRPTVANRPVRNRKPVRGKEPMKTKDPQKAKQAAKTKLKLTTKMEAQPDPVIAPPKRKGPGRPPKNGIISKREQALLARQAKDAAKAAAQGTSDAPPGRGKGKSIPQAPAVPPENSQLQPNGKRKYKKRKTKAEIEAAEQGEQGEQAEQQTIRESTEHTDSVPPDQNAAPPPKPLKPMRPPKPPRSPSPVFDEASLTPEQLAKPQSSYVVLIHDALSNSKDGQMSLPQIYRAIERKYPFYKLRVQTTGWQSSVRHNLSQHPAFRKIERDGKGWMWGLVPEVSIEKEKRRRMTPPPMPSQGYYHPPQPVQSSYPYSTRPIPNPQMPYPLYGAYPGMQRPYPHFPPQPTASSLPPALANAQVDSSSTYQSPYATGPPQQNADTSQPQPVITTTDQASASSLNPTSATEKPPAASTPNPPTSSISFQPPGMINGNHTPASPSNNPNFRPPPPLQPTNHTPEVLAVVNKFKDLLLSSMSDNPRAETLINSAIARVLNPQQNPAPPSSRSPGGEDDHQEKAIMKILQGMLDNMRAKQSKGENDGAGGGAVNGGAAGKGNNSSTFFQILESVSQRNDGTLPLPEQKPQIPHASSDEAVKQEVDHGQQQEGNASVNGISTGEQASKTAEADSNHDTNPASVDEPKRSKRPLEPDEPDEAMDARTLGAKRVAT